MLTVRAWPTETRPEAQRTRGHRPSALKVHTFKKGPQQFEALLPACSAPQTRQDGHLLWHTRPQTRRYVRLLLREGTHRNVQTYLLFLQP